MKRFLSTRQLANGDVVYEIWQVVDSVETGNFLHIQMLAQVEAKFMSPGLPEAKNLDTLIDAGIKATPDIWLETTWP